MTNKLDPKGLSAGADAISAISLPAGIELLGIEGRRIIAEAAITAYLAAAMPARPVPAQGKEG